MDELRKKGLEKMNEVYGWEMPDMTGDVLRADRRPPLRHASGPGPGCRCATSG